MLSSCRWVVTWSDEQEWEAVVMSWLQVVEETPETGERWQKVDREEVTDSSWARRLIIKSSLRFVVSFNDIFVCWTTTTVKMQTKKARETKNDDEEDTTVSWLNYMRDQRKREDDNQGLLWEDYCKRRKFFFFFLALQSSCWLFVATVDDDEEDSLTEWSREEWFCVSFCTTSSYNRENVVLLVLVVVVFFFFAVFFTFLQLQTDSDEDRIRTRWDFDFFCLNRLAAVGVSSFDEVLLLKKYGEDCLFFFFLLWQRIEGKFISLFIPSCLVDVLSMCCWNGE